MAIKVESVVRHSNGSKGTGFYVVLFQEGRGKNRRLLVATVFPERHAVAVLSVGGLALKTAEERFDGPDYEDDLRAATLEFERRQQPVSPNGTRAEAASELGSEEARDLRYGTHKHLEGGVISGTHRGVCVICGMCLRCGRCDLRRNVIGDLPTHERPAGGRCAAVLDHAFHGIHEEACERPLDHPDDEGNATARTAEVCGLPRGAHAH